MIVTIDGPAGAGKSSIAHQVASQLGFEFLDTGALYRAATLAVLRAGIDMHDSDAVAAVVHDIDLSWQQHAVHIDNENVAALIRTPEVTRCIRFLADMPPVRAKLSQIQRQIANGRNIVTEGRDQGAEVFPTAECKFFLTASPIERAQRRLRQLAESGREETLESVLAAQNQRDLEDRLRDVGRLRAAEDAIIVNTDHMTLEQVLSKIVALVRSVMDHDDDPNHA
ncbi:MAG: (d)CMP kinase [Planctomycetota bacterium]